MRKLLNQQPLLIKQLLIFLPNLPRLSLPIHPLKHPRHQQLTHNVLLISFQEHRRMLIECLQRRQAVIHQPLRLQILLTG